MATRKISVPLVIEVDPEVWADTEGILLPDVPQDVRDFVLHDVVVSSDHLERVGATASLEREHR